MCVGLQIRRFDIIIVNDVSRQLIHSFRDFWCHNPPSHRVEHVDKLCEEVNYASLGLGVNFFIITLIVLTEDTMESDGKSKTPGP
jgi:hypothetical protein